jgi:hypothetical protein
MMPIAKIVLDLPVSFTSAPTALIDGKGGLRPLTVDTTLGKRRRKHGVNDSRVKSSTRPPSLDTTCLCTCCSIRFCFITRFGMHFASNHMDVVKH